MYLDKNSVRIPMFGVWVLLMLSIGRVMNYFKDLKYFDPFLGLVLILGLIWFLRELKSNPTKSKAGAKSFGWYLLGYIVIQGFYEGLVEGFPQAKFLGDFLAMCLIWWVYSVAREYIGQLDSFGELKS